MALRQRHRTVRVSGRAPRIGRSPGASHIRNRAAVFADAGGGDGLPITPGDPPPDGPPAPNSDTTLDFAPSGAGKLVLALI